MDELRLATLVKRGKRLLLDGLQTAQVSPCKKACARLHSAPRVQAPSVGVGLAKRAFRKRALWRVVSGGVPAAPQRFAL